MLGRYVRPDTVFLEIGSGDCALVFDICRSVRFGYGLDVSETITHSVERPDNFQLLISDGTSVDVAEGTVDLAYSNQLMEHLHPDDALTQLRNIYRALKPGGIYLCVTPNRLNGPHDISRRFDFVATGLHLKEYTVTELDALFREAGFRKVRFLVGFSGRFVEAGIGVTKALEALIGRLPVQRQISVARTRGIRHMLFPRMVAFK
jgi:SAM-dependent methyltransferase